MNDKDILTMQNNNQAAENCVLWNAI